MNATHATAGLSPPPDPTQDRSGKPVPEQIAFVLDLVHILLAYGRHLTDTLQHRATLRTFSLIAQCFGTRRLAFITASVTRGIMRAIALERVLLARAARGRDLVARSLNDARPRKPRKHAEPLPDGEKPPRRRPAPRPDPDAFLTLDTLPTMEELEKEVRRRPIGRTLVAICCDLGIGSGLCHGRFGLEIFQAISWHRGSFVRYFKEIRRRQEKFEDELDQDRKFEFDWPNNDRAHIHRVLGFFIGEDPVWPDSLLALQQAPAAQPP